jgi:pyruvate formate lyase activating enzyme
MVSNGYINEEPLRELCKYIDAFNIDLKSFSDETYKKLNKGSLEPVLRTLQIIKENNRWLEITFLIVPNWTDGIEMIKKMFEWLFNNGFSEYPLHFIGFFPTYKMTDTPHASHESVEIIKQIARNCGMKNI